MSQINIDPFKLIGITVATLLVTIILLVGIVWHLSDEVSSSNARQRNLATLARQGLESHQALCSLRTSEQATVAQSEKFLSLTPKQIARQYGTAFADIPRTTLQTSVDHQKAQINALHLTCP